MQGDDRANQRRQVDEQHLVVGLHIDGLDQVLLRDIGQEIEDILNVR